MKETGKEKVKLIIEKLESGEVSTKDLDSILKILGITDTTATVKNDPNYKPGGPSGG